MRFLAWLYCKESVSDGEFNVFNIGDIVKTSYDPDGLYRITEFAYPSWRDKNGEMILTPMRKSKYTSLGVLHQHLKKYCFFHVSSDKVSARTMIPHL